MATYNSAGSGNFNVDATWTESGHPSTGDTAIINTGHTVTMTADDAIGSIDIKGTLTTDGTARTLTLDANAQGYICEHRGTVSTTINLVINSDFAGDKLIRLNNGGNGNFNDVSITLESTSRKLTIGTEAASIDGDLTIIQGIFDTDASNNYALTVDGDVTIAAAGGLVCNSSTVNVNSFTISSGGTLSLPDASGSCTITGSKSGWSLQNNSQSLSHNNGTVTQTGNGHHKSVFTNPLYNFVVNMVHLSHQATFRAAGVGGLSLTEVKVAANDVTVTRGTLQFNTSTDNAEMGSLTIGSEGTYTATSGTTTITDENSSNYAIQNNGTFTHSSGTVSIETADHTSMAWSSASQRFNNLTINLGASGRSFTQASGFGDTDNKYIEGDLQITNSTYNVNNQELRVDGDVTLSTNAVLNGATGDVKFGSLTINSGTTYNATSGTTTITTATGAGSSSNRAAFCHASGTFTHNNGLFKTTAGNADVEFTSQSETNNPFYDFEATQYAIAATSPWVVLNNMTIANGFQFNGSSGYAKVLGIMKQTGGTYNASDVSSSTNHFFNHYKLEGGTLDLSNIDITVGSIRNTGGTIS